MIRNLHDARRTRSVRSPAFTPDAQFTTGCHLQECKTYVEETDFVTSLVKLLSNFGSILHEQVRDPLVFCQLPQTKVLCNAQLTHLLLFEQRLNIDDGYGLEPPFSPAAVVLMPSVF